MNFLWSIRHKHNKSIHSDANLGIKSFNKGPFLCLWPQTEIIFWWESCFFFLSIGSFLISLRTELRLTFVQASIFWPISFRKKSIPYSTQLIKELMFHLTGNGAPVHQVYIRDDSLELRAIQCISKAQPRKKQYLQRLTEWYTVYISF